MIRKKVLIFGASGQIGKYCIRRLVKNNFRVVAVTRNTHQKGYILKTQAPIGFIDIVEAQIDDDVKIKRLISENDICINLVGILYEKGKKSTFKKVHTHFPEKISKFCKEEKKNFIHISALALEKAKDSKYAISKIEGEKKIRENLPEATILKPSIVYSVDDNFTTRFMSILGLIPFFPLYYSGKTKFMPIHCTDLIDIIFYVMTKKINSQIIECVGPEIISLEQILKKLLNLIDKKRVLIPLPLFFANLSAQFFQLMPKPLLTQDQLRLLKYDNILSGKYKSNSEIGIPSKRIFDQEVKKYCYMWKEGGEFNTSKYDPQ